MGQFSQIRTHGYFEITDDWGKRIEGETVRCVHCGGHFLKSPGSGKLRGFCTRCNGFLCGPQCAECVPIEMYLERLEAGLDGITAHEMPRDVIVSVPCTITGGKIITG